MTSARKRGGRSHKGNSPACGKRGPRFIIYVVGGVTPSELRACHAVRERRDCDIVLGSECVLTPDTAIKALSDGAVSHDADLRAMKFNDFVSFTMRKG